MYMNALAAARIHTAGVRNTCFFTDNSCPVAGSSCASVSTGGSPFDSGVSWSISSTMTTPMAPAIADPKNPACQPAIETMLPTKMKEKNSPRLWLAEKNP